MQLKKMNPKEILYDPNNPRLWDVRERVQYSDVQIPNEALQDQVQDDLRRDRFEIRKLRESIARIGFLPIDKIVVRNLKGVENKYVVVEGNRRLTAIRWLLDQHEIDNRKLSKEVISSIQSIEVLLIGPTDKSTDLVRWTLQGVRHLSGVKNWEPFQQAVAIKEIINELNMEESEATAILGISTRKAYPLLRALGAFSQMRESDEYGELVDIDMFSYFVEAVKQPNIRQFFDWDEENRYFKNNPDLLYSWITEDPDTNERKIPAALDIRALAKVLGSERATEYFLEPGATLANALTFTRSEVRTEWRERVSAALAALKEMPVHDLENLQESDATLMKQLMEVLQRRLTYYESNKQ